MADLFDFSRKRDELHAESHKLLLAEALLEVFKRAHKGTGLNSAQEIEDRAETLAHAPYLEFEPEEE